MNPQEKGTNTMPQALCGRDLYEAFHLDNTTARNESAWQCISRRARLDYEMAAQALNVTLGLVPAMQRFYLFAALEGVSVTRVDDLAGLLSYIQTQTHPFDRFEIYVLENGREVGYGWYEHCVIDDQVLTWEQTGQAEALDVILNQMQARALQAGGHA